MAQRPIAVLRRVLVPPYATQMAQARFVAGTVSKDTRFAERFLAVVGRGVRSVVVVEAVVLKNRREALLDRIQRILKG